MHISAFAANDKKQSSNKRNNLQLSGLQESPSMQSDTKIAMGEVSTRTSKAQKSKREKASEDKFVLRNIVSKQSKDLLAKTLWNSVMDKNTQLKKLKDENYYLREKLRLLSEEIDCLLDKYQNSPPKEKKDPATKCQEEMEMSKIKVQYLEKEHNNLLKSIQKITDL